MAAELRLDDAAPWRQRYRASTILWSQVAGQARGRGLAITNPSGIYQLYAWDLHTSALQQVTDVGHGVMFGTISPDGHYIYYLEDTQGNELGHHVRVPFEGGAPQDLAPDLPPYSGQLLTVSGQSNLLGFTGATREGFTVYCIEFRQDGSLGERRELRRSHGVTFGPYFSHDGALAVVGSSERSGGRLQFSALAVDTLRPPPVNELWDGEGTSVEPVMFAPLSGDSRLLATSNRTGVKRPLVWDARSGERRDLSLDGIEGEVDPLDWSHDGERVLLVQIYRAVHHLYVYDLKADRARRLEHPPGSYGWLLGVVGYFGPNGEIFAHWQDASHPLQLVALDAHSGHLLRTVLPAGEVPPSQPWRSITFTSSDGQAIQGWLCVPEGEGPFPTILHTHGGPRLVATEAFEPECQAWVDHGFAYCSINYRGSVTFGRTFQEQIYGDLGHLEVEDMVAARTWLTDHGIAKPDQIFLGGRSYGGYLTLQALGLRPDLWAGGMAGVPVTDWTMQYEDCAGTLRGVIEGLFGGTPEDKPEQFAKSSPITYVDRVSAPVLILHNRNDTRCPARPVEAYVDRMEALGKPVEIHWYNAGHLGAMAEREQGIREQEWMLEFAYRVLREPVPVR